MLEGAWILMLSFGLSVRETRPLAAVVALKGLASYLAFVFISESAPVTADLVTGAVGVVIAMRTKSMRGDLIAALFVIFPLIHGFYWSAWEVGVWYPKTYYWLLAGLYTLMAAAACPWEKRHAWSGLVGFWRGALAVARGPDMRKRTTRGRDVYRRRR